MRVMLDIPSQYYVVLLCEVYREKWVRHVPMVAKFPDDKKSKNSPKKWIRTVPNLVDLVQFHLICQMLAKFSGVESERAVFKLRKRIFCVVFAYSIKRAREIRKFHVAVVQRRLRNVQKSVMHIQSCRFANKNYCFLTVLVAVTVVVAETPYCCDPEILLPW